MDQAFVDRAGQLLGQLTQQPDATFHPGQLEAIHTLVVERRQSLVVQRTGWGKSAVYFIATRMLRDEGAGPTLLISPLLALMRNQILAAERMGLGAATINSANTDDWARVVDSLDQGDVDLLLVSPERLANPAFRSDVLPQVAGRSGLLVVDEAHCISDWGHDFRPDYRRITRILGLLPDNVPVLLCTATANDRVVDDIEAQLDDSLSTVRGPLGRDGLALHVVSLPSQAERLAWLAEVLPDLDGSGIIYCLTIADTERVAAWLRLRGHNAEPYHGAIASDTRIQLENDLIANDLEVLVATSALGMGFDKPDLSYVIHFQHPGSPVAYYQQVGRAGRQLNESAGVLLVGREDTDIQDWFISSAFPDQAHAESVIALLDQADGPTSLRAIEAEVNLGHTRLELLLKILAVDGAVTREKGGYQRTASTWDYPAERVERVTAARRDEQRQMSDYIGSSDCRMAYLRHSLNDPESVPCGICDNCTGRALAPEPTRATATEAVEFLRHQPIGLQPRKQWPTGLDGVSGRIGDSRRITPGRALALWSDAGWGPLIRAGRDERAGFADELVEAAAGSIPEWADPAPAWVTCVPSLRRPGLVPALAERLADALGLEFAAVVSRTRETDEQKHMQNSAQQCRNVLGVFAVDGPLPSGPVLLVDDLFDSRWTFTVIGAALRDAGAPAVIPFALAKATGG